MSENDSLENVRTLMDRAYEYTDVPENVFVRMKHPERTLEVGIPFLRDDGTEEVARRCSGRCRGGRRRGTAGDGPFRAQIPTRSMIPHRRLTRRG